MLDQRRRRWAGVVQILYKCFVFAWLVVAFVCDQSRNFRVCRRVTRLCIVALALALVRSHWCVLLYVIIDQFSGLF